MPDSQVESQWIDARQVADLLEVAVGTVQSWRNRREGPPWYKLGGLVRYRRAEVLEWLEHQRRNGAS